MGKMKLFSVLVMFLLLATTVAAVQNNPIIFNRIRVNNPTAPGDLASIHTSVRAEDGPDIENVRVRAYLMDFGGFDAGPITRELTNDPVNSRLFFETPTQPGWYLVRVVASNDKFKRVKHRWIEVI